MATETNVEWIAPAGAFEVNRVDIRPVQIPMLALPDNTPIVRDGQPCTLAGIELTAYAGAGFGDDEPGVAVVRGRVPDVSGAEEIAMRAMAVAVLANGGKWFYR